MQVHPDLARLRGDHVPQPACDAALAAWRALPQVTTARAALAQLAAGKPLEQLPALARLVRNHPAACAFVADFVGRVAGSLRAEPFAQVPLGHSATPGMARLRLIEHGRCCLTLTALAPRPYRASASALFEDGVVHELVVAGAGAALVHHLAGRTVTTETAALEPGVRLTRDGPGAARQIVQVRRPLLLLQLSCEAVHPGPSREIAVDDGRLITAISGCKQTSQHMMALGVLGALGHRSGIGAMATLAQDPARARDLRWEALRQVLAMDAARGLAVLAALANNPVDSLADPAAALRQQLRVGHPDLAALMEEPA